MINLDEVTVITDLRARLSGVTDAQIEAAERKLRHAHRPPEKHLGVIESHTTKGIYALWMALLAERKMEDALCDAALNEIEEGDHRDKAAVLDLFSEVVSQLFWAQAQMDIGFRDKADVGLRKGWVVVQHMPSAHGPNGMTLGGFLLGPEGRNDRD